MKKLYVILMVCALVLVTGCTKVDITAKGDFKEGTYFGFDDSTKTTAVIYVDEDGFIKSVFIDAAYGKKQTDGTTIYTTKQILHDDYGMKTTSNNMGIIVGGAEWYEQMDAVTDKVVSEQNIDWLKFKYRVTDEDGVTSFTDTLPEGQTEKDKLYTDSVAGMTIHADGCYNAIRSTLDQAKK